MQVCKSKITTSASVSLSVSPESSHGRETQRLPVQLTQKSSRSTALLMGTSLGCTKVRLPQGSTQQFSSNFLRPPICKNSLAVIPGQCPWDGAHPLQPAGLGQSLLAIARRMKRKKLRGFYCSFSVQKRLHPGCCAM